MTPATDTHTYKKTNTSIPRIYVSTKRRRNFKLNFHGAKKYQILKRLLSHVQLTSVSPSERRRIRGVVEIVLAVQVLLRRQRTRSRKSFLPLTPTVRQPVHRVHVKVPAHQRVIRVVVLVPETPRPGPGHEEIILFGHRHPAPADGPPRALTSVLRDSLQPVDANVPASAVVFGLSPPECVLAVEVGDEFLLPIGPVLVLHGHDDIRHGPTTQETTRGG